MKIILTFTLFITSLHSILGQTIYTNTNAPKIEFTDWLNNPKGDTVLNDKPIVLEFWSTWCGPCVKAIPHVNELTKKYQNDVIFVSVNSFETREVVEEFLDENKMISFVALDEDESLKNALNIQTIPVTIIIDKKGMLRWRGITTELTDELLNIFVIENEIIGINKKGVLLDEEYAVNSLENVNYQLFIDYGDATLGKEITTNSEGEFYLKLGNLDIYSVLYTFINRFGMNEDLKYEGNLTDKEIINLNIKCKVTLNESDTRELIKDVTSRLSEYFNFQIKSKEEVQTIWYIVPDSIQLEKHLSINQNLETEILERTEMYSIYQNIFFDYLASVLSFNTKEKVEYIPNFPAGKYDLTILESNDIQKVCSYLEEIYGINLVKEEKKVKVKIATFK